METRKGEIAAHWLPWEVVTLVNRAEKEGYNQGAPLQIADVENCGSAKGNDFASGSSQSPH